MLGACGGQGRVSVILELECALGTELRSLQEQQVILTREPSPQALSYFSYEMMHTTKSGLNKCILKNMDY